jgi:hypothetical protein
MYVTCLTHSRSSTNVNICHFLRRDNRLSFILEPWNTLKGGLNDSQILSYQGSSHMNGLHACVICWHSGRHRGGQVLRFFSLTRLLLKAKSLQLALLPSSLWRGVLQMVTVRRRDCPGVLQGGYYMVALKATFKGLSRCQDPGETALKHLKVLLNISGRNEYWGSMGAHSTENTCEPQDSLCILQSRAQRTFASPPIRRGTWMISKNFVWKKTELKFSWLCK